MEPVSVFVAVGAVAAVIFGVLGVRDSRQARRLQQEPVEGWWTIERQEGSFPRFYLRNTSRLDLHDVFLTAPGAPGKEVQEWSVIHAGARRSIDLVPTFAWKSMTVHVVWHTSGNDMPRAWTSDLPY